MTDPTGPPHRQHSRVPSAVLWVGIAFLLAAEAIEYLRNSRRRTSHRVVDWWAEVERREHRAIENAEIAALARGLARPHR